MEIGYGINSESVSKLRCEQVFFGISFSEVIKVLKRGDILKVESIETISRNVRELKEVTEELGQRGVYLSTVREQIDTRLTSGQLLVNTLPKLLELDKKYMLARQQEGIARKVQLGIYSGNLQLKVSLEQFESIYRQWKSKEILAKDAMKALGLKPNTFYRIIKKYEKTGNPNETNHKE